MREAPAFWGKMQLIAENPLETDKVSGRTIDLWINILQILNCRFEICFFCPVPAFCINILFEDDFFSKITYNLQENNLCDFFSFFLIFSRRNIKDAWIKNT